MQPKAVTLVGTGSGIPIPVTVDAQGTLQVSPPKDSSANQAVIFLNAADANSFAFGVETLAVSNFALSFNGTTWDRTRSGAANADALAPSSVGNLLTVAQLFGWNGASFDRVRVANVFKTVSTAAAGLTAVWIPAAGKKFRLMGYTIDVAGTLAATGTQVLTLRDGAATVIKNHVANVIQTQTASISGGDSHMGADLGQGQLSALANNVLNINLGTAMATGAVVVNAWGTEE
jgi:hypothetical protein